MSNPPKLELNTLLAHRDFVRAVARGLLDDEGRAEDVVQGRRSLAALADFFIECREHGCVSAVCNVDFVLSHSDGLNDDHVLSKGFKHHKLWVECELEC